jgi:predicted RNase H-like HicB family nuclease
MKVAVVLEPSTRTRRVRAYCPDLPGCSAVADSEPDALELLRRRIAEYFAASVRRAAPGTRTTTVEV